MKGRAAQSTSNQLTACFALSFLRMKKKGAKKMNANEFLIMT